MIDYNSSFYMDNWEEVKDCLKHTKRINGREFQRPELIDPNLIDQLVNLRNKINKPMYFTKSNSGTYYHPDGDAVEADSPHHAPFSLHKAGIDHVESYKKKQKTYKANGLCVAIDFDFKCDDNDMLFDDYLFIAKETEFSGIGVYPYWNRKGFHCDIRSVKHPSYNYHWFRNKSGSYFPMTYTNWKREVVNA
jgi:hypothetical protein